MTELGNTPAPGVNELRVAEPFGFSACDEFIFRSLSGRLQSAHVSNARHIPVSTEAPELCGTLTGDFPCGKVRAIGARRVCKS